MLRFRPKQSDAPSGDINDLLAVGQLIDDAMRPGHFFVAPQLRFEWIAARSETIAWEVFRGRLVDANQTRQQKTFLSWHMIEQNDAHPATEPTISVKLDVRSRHIHVTRGLLVYAWEGYDAGGGVIESREVVKWTRELVGTMQLADFADLESVRDELICLIWQAIVGTSRLPLTSVEAPLPAFSFGWLHCLYRADAGEQACASWEEWLIQGLRTRCAWRETVKLVEFILRHVPPLEFDELAWVVTLHGERRFRELFLLEWPSFAGPRDRIASALFNDVALSPVTHFMHNAMFFATWAQFGFASHLLPKLCQHLTAYDLITFHQRGANYPDALLLDALLKRQIARADVGGGGFDDTEAKNILHRRALRQGCLMRLQYQGLHVPDSPTSPGENARVLPDSHPRIPDYQMTQANRRQRQLFTELPLISLLRKPSPNHRSRSRLSSNLRRVLEQCVRDLENMNERVEMGLGLFIDRPLGYGKQVGEPDLTPMLAHEAFSPSIARRRWQELKKLCAELNIAIDASNLDSLFEHGPWPAGLPHAEVAECPRPVAALCDVRKVADDFVILRTKPVGLGQMLGYFDNLQELLRRLGFDSKPPRLCVQAFNDAKQPVLALYDEQLRRRVELQMDASRGYVTRAGVELPRAGLQVTAVYEDDSDGASSS